MPDSTKTSEVNFIASSYSSWFLLQGGGFYLLGVQLAGTTTLAVWSIIMAYILLKLVDVTIGLRVPLQQEILGADLVEHAVGDIEYDKKQNKVLCTITGRNLNSEYGLTEDGQIREMPQFNENRRRKSILKLGESINMAAHLSQTFAHLKQGSSIEEEDGEEVIEQPQILDDRQSRRKSITFDLSNVPNFSQDEIKKGNWLWKQAGNKVINTQNGIAQRWNIFKNKRSDNSTIGKTNIHTNGHATKVGNGTVSGISDRPGSKKGDGQENSAFAEAQEDRQQSHDEADINAIQHVSSSDVLVDFDTLSIDRGERTGGVGEETPHFSTYMWTEF